MRQSLPGNVSRFTVFRLLEVIRRQITTISDFHLPPEKKCAINRHKFF